MDSDDDLEGGTNGGLSGEAFATEVEKGALLAGVVTLSTCVLGTHRFRIGLNVAVS